MSSSRSSARASRSKHGRRQSDNVAAAVTDKSHNQNHVKQKEERVLEEKIGQVVQLTGCSKDEAFVALYDCDDDPGRAIDMILERSDQGTWVESTKKKKPVKAAVTGDSGKSPERELAQDHESTATATASVGVRGRARARGGAAARFGQSSRGRQHSLGEDHGAAGWKARERRENEKNSFSGGRGGGRGSRRGGLARVFQSRQRPDVPVSSSTCDDEWSGGLDPSWTTSDDVAAWNGTAATVATADELDEWSGPLTETKVFTPSSCASVDGASAVNTSTVTDHSTDETGVLGPSLDLASLLGKSPGAQGTCAAAAPSVVCSTAASVSYSYSDVAAVNAGVDGNVIDQHAPAHTFSEQSAVATQSSSHNVSASLKHHIETSGASLSATAFTQSSIAQKIKPHKTRMHTSTKIPESAVEMPSDAISTLSVQFGGLDFGTSALSSSVECSSASATSTSTTAFGQHSSLLSVSQQQQQSGTPAPSSVRQSSHLASDRTATTAVLSSLSSSGVNASAAGFHASSSSSASPLYSTQQQPMSSVSSHKTSSSAGNGPLLAGPPYQSIGSTQTAASAATTSSMYHLSTADSPAALPPSSGEQTAAGGTLSGQPAPGFGSYVNGAAAAASSGGYLSAGVSIKDKLASALSASPSSKNSQLESGMGVGLSSSGAVSSVSSSLSSSVINNGASAPAAATLHKQLAPVAAGATSSSRAATGVPALPPGVPMQYFMGQHAGVPTAAAFYPPAGVQQIYTGYEDLHSLQQRLPPHLQQQQQHSGVSEQARGDAPASLTNSNPAAAVTAAAAAAAYTSDNGSGKFSRQQENNSPISSALSQPQNPSQQQPQFFNAATLPPNYTYYPYLTPYGIYTQLPQVTNAPPHPQPAAASSQYQKLGGGGGSMPTGSSYGSGAAPAQYGAVPSAAFDPLASSSAVDYKSPFGSGAGGVSSATGGSGGAALGAAANMAAVAGSHANHKTGGGAASDVYGKMQQLSKSFDNKGFHAATPPPFGMPAAAGQAGAAGGGPYPSHHMIFQQLAPQHPSQMVGHHHHHHHHLPAAVQQHHSHHAHETGGGSTAGMQRAPSSVSHNAVAGGPSTGSVVKSSAIKPGYSTGYWSAN